MPRKYECEEEEEAEVYGYLKWAEEEKRDLE